MPIQVQIPGPLRPLTGGQSEVEVEAGDVSALIAALDERHRGVRDRLLDGSGALRRHVRIFVNDEDVRALQQEATPLRPGDRVSIVPAIAGGVAPGSAPPSGRPPAPPGPGGGGQAEALPTKEEAIARLEAYQARLDEAQGQGRAAYDALFDNAPAGVALHEIDLQATVTRVNARELEVLGHKREDVLGKPVWQFSVMKEASQRAVDKKLSGGGLKPFVRTLTRQDQTAFTAAFVERYLRDAKGGIAGIRTSFMPIRG